MVAKDEGHRRDRSWRETFYLRIEELLREILHKVGEDSEDWEWGVLRWVTTEGCR